MKIKKTAILLTYLALTGSAFRRMDERRKNNAQIRLGALFAAVAILLILIQCAEVANPYQKPPAVPSQIAASSQSSLAIDAWNHVVCTYDGQTMRTYVNGALDHQHSYAKGFLYPQQNASIGCAVREGDGVEGWFQGDIDDLMLIDHALDASAVKGLYDETKPAQ